MVLIIISLFSRYEIKQIICPGENPCLDCLITIIIIYVITGQVGWPNIQSNICITPRSLLPTCYIIIGVTFGPKPDNKPGTQSKRIIITKLALHFDIQQTSIWETMSKFAPLKC